MLRQNIELGRMCLPGHCNLQTSTSGLSKDKSVSSLSGIESTLSESETDQTGLLEHTAIKRSLSLPMSTNTIFVPSSSFQRRPSLKIHPRVISPPQITFTKTNSNYHLLSPNTPDEPLPKPLQTFVPAPLTPPDETGQIEFIMNPPSSPPNASDEKTLQLSTGTPDPPPSISITSSTPQKSQADNQAASSTQPSGDSSTTPVDTMFDEVVAAAVSSIEGYQTPASSIKIVHQALPYPLPHDKPSSSTVSAYIPLMNALRQNSSLQGKYLHTTHTLPFGQSPGTPDLRSSPVIPSSPSSTSSPQGYFDLVVNNVSYLANPYPPQSHDAPTSPAVPSFALPPREAAVSLYERIIPPSNRHEASELFEPFGRSALLDRLQELAPGGALIVVYPTQAGGRAFQTEYLDPVLDPVLRGLMEEHGLWADLGMTLSLMAAVEDMLPFEMMHAKIEALLRTLNENNPNDALIPFSLVHASSKKVQVTRQIWEDWWIHQEKPRIMARMMAYIRRGKGLPRAKNATHSYLAQQLVENLSKRGKGENTSEPKGEGNGIEVGLFVIKRLEV